MGIANPGDPGSLTPTKQRSFFGPIMCRDHGRPDIQRRNNRP
jgi:hypothetical protein